MPKTGVLRQIGDYGQLLIGLALVAVGVLLLTVQEIMILSASYLLGASLLVIGAAGTVGWFLRAEKRLFELVWLVLCIPFGVLVFLNRSLPMTVIVILIGLYLLFSAAVKAVDAALLWQEEKTGFLISACQCLLFAAFGVLLLIAPWTRVGPVLNAVAVYMILAGALQAIGALHRMVPGKAKQKVRRHIRIALPVVMEVFVPYAIQKRINRSLVAGMGFDQLKKELPPRESGAPDMEVFIHVADTGVNTFGHCDICFEGMMYAYGSYDEAAMHFGLAPGILIIAPKEEYIPFTSGFAHTTIFGFGLRLSEAQKDALRARLAEIRADTVPWVPPYQQALAVDPTAKYEDYTDYPSRLAVNTQAHFYRFTRSKYKTYFIFTTNCAMFPLDVLGKLGVDVLSINGILTPGTLYDFLEDEYLNRRDLVIQRTIYRMTPQGLLTTDGAQKRYKYRQNTYRTFKLKPVIPISKRYPQAKSLSQKHRDEQDRENGT